MDCPDAIMGDLDGGSREDEAFANVDKDSSSDASSKTGTKVQTSSEVLRKVTLPGDLISKFLEVAKENSDNNIETLGTIGGQLYNNELRVTNLLIPKQTGTSDSCTMHGMEDVWEYHDKENILFLGWIHTHPGYSVYLSSVDMHNQYERQRMLPEVSQFSALSRS